MVTVRIAPITARATTSIGLLGLVMSLFIVPPPFGLVPVLDPRRYLKRAESGSRADISE